MPDNIANPSNIASLIGGIMESKNRIKTKLLDLGLAAANDSLYDLSYEITDIANNGAISATVQEGTSYTIPAGYHNGAGVVTGISGGGNYQLQAKGPITPTKSQQQITSDEGYYGLSGVTIDPIPDAYQDVSSVTAQASQVLATKIFVNSAGNVVTGTMTNNGAVNQTISVATPSYTIPSGYHNGSGKVSIVTETKSVTPSASAQTINATAGKVISSVTVGAIPSPYYDVSGVTAVASQVLAGTSFVTAAGTLTAGAMTNQGAISKVLDANGTFEPGPDIGTRVNSYTVPSGYHNGNGIVKIVLEEKSTTPSKSSQDITPTSGRVLSKVTVGAIPGEYQDVTQVTATAADVVASKKFVDATGSVITGTMVNRGTISTQTLSTATTSYTIPAGKHSGSGKVQIVLEEKSATPSTSAQNIVPTSGKVLSKVAIAAIPTAYRDVTGVTATASQVLSGASYVTAAGVLTTGTMANVGAQVSAIDGLTVASKLITQGYHDGTGYVYLTNDIEIALSSI